MIDLGQFDPIDRMISNGYSCANFANLSTCRNFCDLRKYSNSQKRVTCQIFVTCVWQIWKVWSEFGKFGKFSKLSGFGEGRQDHLIINFFLYIKWPSLKICHISQICQNAVTDKSTDLPDLPTFAKGHFWEKCDSPCQNCASYERVLQIWREWPLLTKWSS